MSEEIANYQKDLTQLSTEISQIETKLQSPDLSRNSEEYISLTRDYSAQLAKQATLNSLIKKTIELAEAEELTRQEHDPEFQQLAKLEQDKLKEELNQLRSDLKQYSQKSSPEDKGNAIIEIRAGTGGEEAALFAQELFRAYSKFAASKGLHVEIANISYSGVGGFKEIIFFIEGRNAYGLFKYESGVHRVQRVPATESAGRIHTSTISVVVLPETEEKQVEIKPEDIRIDVYRATGPGGQSVNTTDSAVRIVHIPSGIVVTCQDQKSQLKNKAKAMKILQAKLYDKQQQETSAKLGEIRQAAIQTGDRSAKIRTYNFPQSRVTDHRTKQSWFNIGEILEGNFDEITNSIKEYFENNDNQGTTSD